MNKDIYYLNSIINLTNNLDCRFFLMSTEQSQILTIYNWTQKRRGGWTSAEIASL